MNLIRWMRWTNGLLALSALAQIFTGAMLFFRLQTFVLFPVLEIHRFNGIALIILIFIHAALNWPWFKTHYFRRRPINRLVRKK